MPVLDWYDELAAIRNKLDADKEALMTALRPFAKAVYNDNGSMIVTPANYDDYIRAYFVFRRIEQEQRDQ